MLVLSTAAVLVTVGGTPASAGRPVAAPLPSVPTPTLSAVTSQTPSVSGDGRYVVYAGAPVDAADTRTSTVFLKDRAAHVVTELTTPVDGLRAGNSVWPVISNDGCNVVVITEFGYDLFRDDDQGDRWDVYKLHLPQCGGTPGDWELVSSTGTGLDTAAADDVSPLYPPAVSGEGAIVAYTSRFGLSAPDVTAVTVVDLTVPIGDPGRVARVAGTPGSAPDSTFRYHGVRQPSVSLDGSVVAFASDALHESPLGAWGNGPQPGGFARSNVYVWDRTNPDPTTDVRRISAAPGGDTGDADSPSVSGDGRWVAFVSTASNLVPGASLPACTPGCAPQVYLFDRTDGSIRLGSRVEGDPTAPPVATDTGATQPALNGNGDELVYISRATNLFPTRSSSVGAPGDGDVVLTVPSTGAVQRVSVLADGVSPAPAANSHPAISTSGRVVVFDTLAGAAYGNPRVPGRQVAEVERPPELQLANLDMGTVAVGYPGPEWFLVVANRGPSSFVPNAVLVDNTDYLISGGTCVDQRGVAVPPGGACTVNLMLMPSKPGPSSATLTVAEGGFGATLITSQLTGNGGDPTLAPSPGGADASSLVVGARGEPMTFTMTNVAFNPVKVKSVRLAGSNPGDFTLGDNTCRNKKLDAAATCTIDVLFTPTGAGRRTATVVVTSDDGSYSTMLVSGDAHYEPKLAVTTTTLVAPARLVVIGAGFAPNAQVTLAWSDGFGHPLTVTTDAQGGLLAVFIVRPTDRAGNRTLVAQTTDGQFASAAVHVVVPPTMRGPASPNRPTG
jgi:Tol biopolymer transport system component